MELFIELLNQQLISIHFRVAISSIVIDVTIKHRNTFYMSTSTFRRAVTQCTLGGSVRLYTTAAA